ncbi:TPA: hypothetical protein ACUNF5_002731 [Burkholderia orbicola]|nr:hypothetical protein DF039_35685 [Burkholderia cenocepacia]
MRSLGYLFGALILGLCVASGIAFAMHSLGTFVQFIPPLPWAIGVVLLIAAGVIGVVRGRHLRLGLVVVWMLGIGFTTVIGQDANATPMRDAIYHLIPWTFVAGCALACVINATL